MFTAFGARSVFIGKDDTCVLSSGRSLITVTRIVSPGRKRKSGAMVPSQPTPSTQYCRARNVKAVALNVARRTRSVRLSVPSLLSTVRGHANSSGVAKMVSVPHGVAIVAPGPVPIVAVSHVGSLDALRASQPCATPAELHSRYVQLFAVSATHVPHRTSLRKYVTQAAPTPPSRHWMLGCNEHGLGGGPAGPAAARPAHMAAMMRRRARMPRSSKDSTLCDATTATTNNA